MSQAPQAQTLEQRRAQHALRQIKVLQNQNVGHYVSYVSAMPAVIVMNGLGQALAMQLAKAKGDLEDLHYRLYHQVASWLSEQLKEFKGQPDQVIENLMRLDQSVYLRAQAESLAYLSWLKQFARAYLKETEGNND